METLQVQMCVYKLPGKDERVGILIYNIGSDVNTSMIVDFAKREIVEGVVSSKPLPDEGTFKYHYGYTPAMRKTIKESRRLARAK